MRRRLDQYETGAHAVDELRRRIEIQGPVTEPCSGMGTISRCFVDCDVRTNDIDPEMPSQLHEDARQLSLRCGDEWIVTNPPFGEVLSIVSHFVELGARCAFLLRLSFLEPTLARGSWLSARPPTGIIVLPRYSFTGDGKTDSVTCAWMLWNTEPIGIQIAKRAAQEPKRASSGERRIRRKEVA